MRRVSYSGDTITIRSVREFAVSHDHVYLEGMPSRNTRRTFLLSSLTAATATLAGCSSSPQSGPSGKLEKVWGGRGLGPGLFQKPRAMAIDAEDRLYIVDMTARIQVFTRDGEYLHSWRTPESKNGRPTGLSIDRDGNLCVADTHYFRMLVYTPAGKLLPDRTIGGESGSQPGQFNFVTDVAQDTRGNYYISEYGEYDRVQKFTRDGKFLMQWGRHGSQLGEFMRPQSIMLDADDRLWVADSCNHRIQVFETTDTAANLVQSWGVEGSELGQLRYPYGLQLDGQGHVYLCEYGNHRVQKFTLSGELIAWWGSNGRKPGELIQPWTAQLDSRGRLHVLDSYNHRVQRIVL
jgi:sugar lactone lactonase YvrE